MKTQDRQLAQEAEGACLQQVHDLGDAVNAALLAIADDSLDALEDSLWKQQVLCVGLQHSLERMSRNGVDQATVEKILSALLALVSLNTTYSKSIDEAWTSADLLYKLCASYQGSAGEDLLSSSSSTSSRPDLCTI